MRRVEVVTEGTDLLGELLDVRVVRVVPLRLFDPIVDAAADLRVRGVEVLFGLVELRPCALSEVIGLLLQALGLVGRAIGDVAAPVPSAT